MTHTDTIKEPECWAHHYRLEDRAKELERQWGLTPTEARQLTKWEDSEEGREFFRELKEHLDSTGQ